ncbi:HAD-superfamily subfamily IB hydrolase, TIGR01490 [Candidatus Saccharibacteria bacterium RAAC3_TM7_1]|nr:HAD-superfamily subfamily IB hydrolase, TIGR01490 [Candidatus Saccharibacteria bacterium RAAC3_TM7_1]HCZ28619.1 HAD-IB family hydrolase [Candidatus Saccharibacteria bacterium]
MKFAVFDIDGTVFRWQLYYEVVLKLLERGFFEDHQANAIRASFHAWQSRKEAFHTFEIAAIKALDESLTRLKVEDFELLTSQILEESGHKVYAYTTDLATSLKAEGYYLLALSGSMQEIAEPFAKSYGFDECIGWLYERKDHAFTGKVARATVGNKAAILKDYFVAHDVDLKGSIAVGDSKSDIEMLELVERGIAFNPSEELLEAAKQHNWEVVIERKNIAYTMQKGRDGLYVLAQTDTF